jgi:hypothetical protein
LNLAYIGAQYPHKSYEDYPCRATDSVYKDNRVRFFVNIPTWLDFLRQADFSFGSRLHGNIAATLAGTPSIFFPYDARSRELAEYHNLTRVPHNDVSEDLDIFNVIEKVDFQAATKNQGRNFDHYVRFLDINGLDHIYKNSFTPTLAPLDKKMGLLELHPPVQPLSGCSFEEIVQRLAKYHNFFENELKDKKIEIKDKNKEIIDKNKELKTKDKEIKKLTLKVNIQQKLLNDQTKLLNYRSVKFTLKFRNAVAKTRLKLFK